MKRQLEKQRGKHKKNRETEGQTDQKKEKYTQNKRVSTEKDRQTKRQKHFNENTVTIQIAGISYRAYLKPRHQG